MKRKPLLCRLEHHPKTETIGVGKTLERCTVCGGWITWASKFIGTAVDFGVLFLLMAMLAALMTFATGCAPVRLVPGTVVPLPRVEYADDWVRSRCWATHPAFPEHACCVYSQDLTRLRLICTRNGGDNWDLLDDSRGEPEPGPHASMREGCAEGYDDGRVRCT